MISRIRAFIDAHERILTPVAFILGFIWDSFTLTRIDLWLDNLILFTYLAIATICIILYNIHVTNRFRLPFARLYANWFPFLIQFAFGGLFSGYVVFYSRSASLISSWPFILFLILLLVGNELFKKQYARLQFQIGVLFIALFSFSIFYIPILLNRLGTVIFLISGVVSLICIAGILFVIGTLMPETTQPQNKRLGWTVGIIYIFFTVAYFTNIIPPIPLALKEAGVYHSIVRDKNDAFIRTYEAPEWYQLQKTNPIFNFVTNDTVYHFAAVFAPTDLKTVILHRWQYYSEARSAWITTDSLRYAVVGGRDGGYRGYTSKRNIKPGQWRIDVVTERGQLLGRTAFTIVASENTPPLTQVEE